MIFSRTMPWLSTDVGVLTYQLKRNTAHDVCDM